MSCLGIYHVPSCLACYVYSMLCSIFFWCFIFYLSFIFSFILHPLCIIFYPCSYLIFFPSFLLIHLSIHDKKGESIPVSIVISIWLMCIILGEENHRGNAYTKGGEDIFLRKPCFVFILYYACFLVVLWCFELCLVSMLCCSHRIMLMCWTCIYPYAIVLYWLYVQMIICFVIWSL